jgi:hypothetical protein
MQKVLLIIELGWKSFPYYSNNLETKQSVIYKYTHKMSNKMEHNVDFIASSNSTMVMRLSTWFGHF